MATSVVVELIIRMRDAASAGLVRVRDGISGIGSAVNSALEPLRAFSALIVGAVGIGGSKELLDRAEAYTKLTNSLRIASTSEEDYQASLASVQAVARDANAELDSTANLYGKIKLSAERLGISQQEVADATETVAKGMQLSGAATAASAGATLQFTQALASGLLRGDEFNSVMEASPALIKAIADGLGVATGELRGMAEAGQLTADRVIKALLSQKAAIDETYAKLPQSVGQAMTQLGNAATTFVGKLNEQTGATQTLGAGLKFLASNMDAVASAMGAAFAASIAKGVQSLGQLAVASVAARDAARQQAVAAEQQQAANLAAVQGQVAAAQAAYNRALAEQRAAAAQLAALESLAGLFASEEALTAARQQSSSAALAATAATERYAAAQAALAAAQAPAAASAGLFGRALGFLAGPGGLILTAVASFGLLFAAFQKQKPAADELTGSIDQFAEALKKMNAAQLAAAEIKLGQSAAEIQTQIAAKQAYIAELQRQLDFDSEIRDSAEQTRKAEEAKIVAEGELADLLDKATALEAKRTAARQQGAAATQTAASATLAESTAINQMVVALDKSILQMNQREKGLTAIGAAEEKQTQALLEQAVAQGKLAEADRLTLELARQKAANAEQAAVLALREAQAQDAKVEAYLRLEQINTSLTQGEQESLRLARESAAVKHAEADAARAVAEGLRAQVDAARSSNLELANHVRLAGQTVSATEGVIRAQADALRSEIAVAAAKGETAKAQRLTRDLAQLEADGAVKVAKAKQIEQTAEYALAVAKRNQVAALVEKNQATKEDLALAELTVQKELAEAQAAGQQVANLQILANKLREINALRGATNDIPSPDPKPTKEYTEAVDANAEALKKNKKEAIAAAGAAVSFAAVIKQVRDEVAALSDRALDELDRKMAALGQQSSAMGLRELADDVGLASAAIQDLQQHVEDAQAAFRYNYQNSLFASGIGQFLDALKAAQAEVIATYYQQRLAVEQIKESLDSMTQAGVVDLGTLKLAAEATNGSFDLLKDQDLDALRQSIDAANEALRRMKEEAQSAKDRLAELNAEIARERGDTAAADRLSLELEQRKKMAEVEAELAKARNEQNQELIRLYEEQKNKLQELYDLKERNLEQEQRQAKTASASNAGSAGSSSSSGSSGSSGGAGSSGKTYTVNLVAPGGNTLTATTSTDPSAFLDELERAQARSLA